MHICLESDINCCLLLLLSLDAQSGEKLKVVIILLFVGDLEDVDVGRVFSATHKRQQEKSEYV